MLKKLPIGISDLRSIKAKDYLYVDKTKAVHRLITSGECYFLSRPRRFGKSLLIDTLKELFLGNKELFNDLWIGQENRHDWQPHPVIHIDFSTMDSTSSERLESGLCRALDKIAEENGIDLSVATFPATKIMALVPALAQKGSVIILIDEYDAPILNNIIKPELASANREILRTFYTCIKGLGPYLHFTFIAGVSKFAKTSIFSGMNNLNDISLEPIAATLCGYTQQELEEYFSPYIELFRQNADISMAQALEGVRHWYNGYRFSVEPIKVYNPFSILHFAEKKRFSNYWFATGSPRFLIDLVKNNIDEFNAIDHVMVRESSFSTFDIETLPLTTVLYQTGYLTIEEYRDADQTYRLTFPNEEVRKSLTECLVEDFLRAMHQPLSSALVTLRKALNHQDVNTFCQALQSLFSGIAYQLHIRRELYYHSLFQMAGTLLGATIQSEVVTSTGRIDVLWQTKETIYIFELKLDESAKVAMAQIKEKRYAEPYLYAGKAIYLIGLSFDFDEKLLTYEWEKVTTPPTAA